MWAAITTAEGLGAWFGDKATVDLRVGGAGPDDFEGGHRADIRMERVEPPNVFGYTWGISGLPEPTIRAVPMSSSPLNRPAKGPGSPWSRPVSPNCPRTFTDGAYGGNIKGWASELGELVEYLDAAHDTEADRRRGLRRPGRPQPAAPSWPRSPPAGRPRRPTWRPPADHAAGDRQTPGLLTEAGLVTAEPGERRRVRYRLRSAPMQVAQQFSPRWPVTGTRCLDALDGS